MDEQPGFVIEGARVALGPLRMDLVATYQRWENDLEVANANGRVIPFTLEATRERIAGRSGKSEFCDFTVYDRADQAPIGWSSLFRIDHRNGTAQFGIDLGERGQGLGTEAAGSRSTGASACSACTTSCSRSRHGMSGRSGSTQGRLPRGGRRRGAGLTMGRRSDGVFMDLLATEFLQANGSVLAAARHTGSVKRVGRRCRRRLGNPQPATFGPLLHQSNPIRCGRVRLGALLALAPLGHQSPHGVIQHGKDRCGVARSPGPDTHLRPCSGWGKVEIGHGNSKPSKLTEPLVAARDEPAVTAAGRDRCGVTRRPQPGCRGGGRRPITPSMASASLVIAMAPL